MPLPRLSRRHAALKTATHRKALLLELLESRDLPAVFYPSYVLLPQGGGMSPLSSPAPTGTSPGQIRHAYGFDQITFPNGGSTVAGDGTGTTIAIVDAFDDPNIATDLQAFDAQFSLPNPTFTKVDQTGGTNYPPSDAGWSGEIALDVEWAHAIAPGAAILLVEAKTNNNSDLFAAASFAAKQTGVVAVSMSFAGSESANETTTDNNFKTPTSHTGVTFVAGSGDVGAPASYPATSPNVLAVGGTTLTMDSSGNIINEVGWTGSGGGISGFESQPSYQTGVVTQSVTKRTNPDVAYNSDGNTGYPVYDTVNNPISAPWSQTGGTSAAAPQWAALISIADQGRIQAGLTPLDGVSQVLPQIYALPAADFHDISSGTSMGTPNLTAAAGYDLVTGRGSPLANQIVSELVGMTVTSSTPAVGSTVLTPPTSYTITFSQPVLSSTLQASDLTVDSVPANSVVLNAAKTTATFNFNSAPFATQGVHTMHIAGSAVGESKVTSFTNQNFTGTFTFTAPAATTFKVSTNNSSPVAGTAINVTVAAQDNSGNASIGYTGAIHFATSDANAAVVLPQNYTFLPADNGVHVFTAAVTLITKGNQTLTAADAVTSSIAGTLTVTVKAAATTHFSVSGPSSIKAGSPFGIFVSALDVYNNVANAYSGTVHITTTDAQASLQDNATLSSGSGFFAALLRTAGSQVLIATDTVTSSITGASSPIIVSGLGVSRLAVLGPPNVTTGSAFNFTVIAQDSFGNTATGYSGTVQFASSDAGATLPSSSTLTAGVGLFSATLKTSGTMTLTATDTSTGSIAGVSNNIISRGLLISSLTPTPTGFVVVFNRPVDPTAVNLYDTSGAFGADDVTLTGPGAPLTSFHGSLLFDATNTAATFVKTSLFNGSNFNPNSGVLAAGTYTVTLRTGANGFADVLGDFLDGNNSGNPAGSNYVVTFVLGAPPVVIGIPSFARGPSDNVDLPNTASGNLSGIPLNVSNGSGVTAGQFTLEYNSALLEITGASVNSAIGGGALTLDPASTPGEAILDFTSAVPLSAGVVRLGTLQADVPDTAAELYKSKALLHFAGAQLNGGAIAVEGDDAVEVVAYIGDTNGDGTLSSGDAALIAREATNLDANASAGILGGLSAYRLADPVLLSDLSNHGNTDSSDVTLLNSELAGVARPQVPPVNPNNLSITPTGPDPTLSLPSDLLATAGGTLVVGVNIDHTRPVGSTGMMEAVLALRYDPNVFDISAADIGLGTLTGGLDSGTLESSAAWQLLTSVNTQTGEIGIDVFGTSAIQVDAAGSLVTLTLHVRDTAAQGASTLNVVAAVNPTGHRLFRTAASDAQGAFVLHPAVTDGGSDQGVDGMVAILAPGDGRLLAAPVGTASSATVTPSAHLNADAMLSEGADLALPSEASPMAAVDHFNLLANAPDGDGLADAGESNLRRTPLPWQTDNASFGVDAATPMPLRNDIDLLDGLAIDSVIDSVFAQWQ